MQLRIDGGEDPLHRSWPLAAGRRLSDSQRKIIEWAIEYGDIRAFEAGAILHAARGRYGCTKGKGWRGQGCCVYAATDGSAALVTLAEHGLLVKAGENQRAPYRIAEEPAPPVADGLTDGAQERKPNG